MPEKTMDTTDNKHTPTGKPAESVDEVARRYVREAESRTRDTINRYNSLIKTSTNYYVDTWDRAMRHGMEWGKYMTGAWENMFTMYRRMYMDNYKTWNAYWDEIYDVMPSLPR